MVGSKKYLVELEENITSPIKLEDGELHNVAGKVLLKQKMAHQNLSMTLMCCMFQI